MTTPGNNNERLCLIVSSGSGIVAIAVGLAVLIGWVADIPALKSVVTGFATMKVNTASLFVLSGLSLVLVSPSGFRYGRQRAVGLVAAAIVTIVSSTTLAQYLFTVDLGIDQLLVRPSTDTMAAHPGRMAAVTAILFAVTGVGLGLSHAGVGSRIAHGSATVAFLLSVLCVLSYLYDADSLRSVDPFSTVAVHTAMTFTIVSVGLLAAIPNHGVVALVVSPGVGGDLTRRLLPIAIVIPVLAVWAGLEGQHAGWYGIGFEVALFAVAHIALFVGLVYWAATRVDKTEASRLATEDLLRQSENHLREANARLEQRVADRTAELRSVNDRLRLSIEATGMGLWETSCPAETLGWDDKLKAIWGLPPDAEVTDATARAMIDPADLPSFDRAMAEAFGPAGNGRFAIEHRIRTPGGEERWVAAWGQRESDDRRLPGEPVRCIGVMRDVTERRQAAARVEVSEERYRTVLEDQTEIVSRFRSDGTFVYVNGVFCRTFGIPTDEVIGRHWMPTAYPDDVPRIEAALARLRPDNPVERIENRVYVASGELRWMEFVNRGFFGRGGELVEVQSVGRDVTDRKQIEDRLRLSLEEKDVLLKEIHHRVKNNLQLVSALLELQSGGTDDPTVRETFTEIRGRVKSMALIHERLYRSQDMACVSLAEYVHRLAGDLIQAYNYTSAHIRLDVAVDIPPVSIDTAIPCGLILNELISNCLKHAFVGRTSGSLRVAIYRSGGANVLSVADDGPGLPAQIDVRMATTFGLQLIKTLAAQLGGQVELTTGPGSTFTVRFPGGPR